MSERALSRWRRTTPGLWVLILASGAASVAVIAGAGFSGTNPLSALQIWLLAFGFVCFGYEAVDAASLALGQRNTSNRDRFYFAFHLVTLWFGLVLIALWQFPPGIPDLLAICSVAAIICAGALYILAPPPSRDMLSALASRYEIERDVTRKSLGAALYFGWPGITLGAVGWFVLFPPTTLDGGMRVLLVLLLGLSVQTRFPLARGGHYASLWQIRALGLLAMIAAVLIA